jgi:hypothetical protein
VEQNLALRIVLVVAGILALASGMANGFLHGWQDIVNLITIFAALLLILIGILSGEGGADPHRNFVRRRR